MCERDSSDIHTLTVGPDAELDAEVGRVVFGIDVLGMAPCTPSADSPDELVSTDGGTVIRPVAVLNIWEPTDPRYACGCLEDEDREAAIWGRTSWVIPVLFGHTEIHLQPLPRYSTRIEDAWSVAEKIRERGLEIIISDGDLGWYVEISVRTEEQAGRGYRGVYRSGASVAEVICRAAIYACANARPS